MSIGSTSAFSAEGSGERAERRRSAVLPKTVILTWELVTVLAAIAAGGSCGVLG